MSDYVKAIADLGNTAVLAYLVCVLLPRGAVAIATSLKWMVEVFFKEQASDRQRTVDLIRSLTGQMAHLAGEKNGGPLHRSPSPSASLTPAPKD